MWRAIALASFAPSVWSSEVIGQPIPSPCFGEGLGMMWKWTWKTAWWAPAPLFWRTL